MCKCRALSLSFIYFFLLITFGFWYEDKRITLFYIYLWTCTIIDWVQFKLVFMCSNSPYALHLISDLRNVAFETVPTFVWLTMALSDPFVERFFFWRFFPPGDRWCDVFRLVTQAVSQDPQHSDFPRRYPLVMVASWRFYLLGHFLWLRRVQNSTSTGVFKGDTCTRVRMWMPVWASHSTFHS